jgi:ankyrin repeat protein
LVHHPAVDASEAISREGHPEDVMKSSTSGLLSLLNTTRRYPIAPILQDDARRLFKILLDAMKPDEINKPNTTHSTMLTEAIAYYVPMDILHDLVQRGADVNYSDSVLKFTPLMLASTPEQVVFLLENGAKIDAVNTFGNTALTLAVKANRLSVVQTLLERGANTDLQNNNGETAMILASRLRVNRVPMVRLFLEKGAEYNLTNKSGRSAWNYAEEQKDGLDDLLSEYQTRNKAKNAVRNHSGFPTNVSKIVGNYLGGRRRRSKTRRGRSKTRRSKTCHRRRRH